MAGMFYSLEETAQKLGRSEDEIRDLIKNGKLREFRDGTKQIFKVDEVDKLADTLKDEPDVSLSAEDSVLDLMASDSDEVNLENEGDMSFSSGDLDDIFSENEDDIQAPASDAESEDDVVGLVSDDEDQEDQPQAAQDEGKKEDEDEDEVLLLDDENQDEKAEEQEDKSVKSEEPDEQEDQEPDELPVGTDDSDEQDKAQESEFDVQSIMDSDDDSDNEKSEDDEDDILLSPDESVGEADEKSQTQEDEIKLEETTAPDDIGGDKDLAELTGADTNIGTTGINVLGDTDDEFNFSDDTIGETKIADAEGSGELGDLDDDLNMDSVGSGSGLLDLSLQADDTSLGAVLDDILPGGDEGGGGDVDFEDMGGEDLLAGSGQEDQQPALEEPLPAGPGAEPDVLEPAGAAAAPMPAAGARYIEAPPDGSSNIAGISILLPMIALVFSALVLFMGAANVTPGYLSALFGEMAGLSLVWWIIIGIAVFSLIMMTASLMGGGSGTSKPKKAKAPKPKKEKKVKPKKGKKSKK